MGGNQPVERWSLRSILTSSGQLSCRLRTAVNHFRHTALLWGCVLTLFIMAGTVISKHVGVGV